MKEVKISVRELVEFIFRQGSIDNRVVSAINGVDGIRAHQRIQKQYGENGQAEVPLKLQFEFCDAIVKIEGRADGILQEESGFVIDEIKLMAGDISHMEESHNILHWAQVMTYGYIFAKEKELEVIQLQLTYSSFEDLTEKRFRKKLRFVELEAFYQDLIKRYKEWLRLEFEWGKKRDASISECEFPFPAYRPGQRELAVRAYKSIEKGVNCFAQAPTGIGKTVSTVFPAIKALGMGLTSKIFYFTAKTITREAAEASLKMLREKGLQVKSVTLTAKEKICKMAKVNCNPEYCPYADGHFDRVNDGIRELLLNSSTYNREALEAASERFQVCPFELALDMTLWADVIICDYNYLFDPRVYLKRFFEVKKTDYTFLIDEAHNLIDRARSMYSAELLKTELFALKNDLDKKEKKLRDVLNKMNKVFLEVKKNMEKEYYVVNKESPTDLQPLLSKFLELGGEYLERRRDKGEKEPEEDLFLEVYFKIYTFMGIWEYYDEKYLTVYHNTGKDIEIKLYCVDPSRVIQERMKLGKANIVFSATLLPLEYFTSLFGAKEEDFVISLESPFSKENRLLLIGDSIDTTYKRRDYTAEELADYIGKCVLAKAGKYMVFLPSYAYMEKIYEVFKTRFPMLGSVIQERNMSEEDKESFLAKYRESNEEDPSEAAEKLKEEREKENNTKENDRKENNTEDNKIEDKDIEEVAKKSHVGFCVLGGHFSEGIDLTADQLIGVIVVGVGMPQLGADRDIIKDYFDELGKDGFEQSYVFPGFIKVLQAAGRCIRTETDRGVIMLLDSRYGQYRYKRLFPKEWNTGIRVRSEKEVDKKCAEFWGI